MRNRTFLAVMAVATTLFLTTAAQAQQLKIATVNMTKLFDKYYKKQQAEAGFKEIMGALESQRKELVVTVQKTEKEYKELLERANDQAISSDERDKTKQAADRKFRELKDLEQTYQEFAAQAKAKLEEKQRFYTDSLVSDIKNAVEAKAKAGGFSLVIDVDSKSGTQTPIVLYTNGETDLTSAVLDQLNAAASVLSGSSTGSGAPFKQP